MTDTPAPRRDKPWMFRTYAGHSTARESNKLYRSNLAKGQTGLSIAFDLPTQTGYDSDHPLSRGEVGKVGVPVSHLGDMSALFEGIPLDEMNTSMTINATAVWLMALYIAAAEEQGVAALETARHDAERHHQGISVAGLLCVSAGAIAAADARPHPVHHQRGAEVQPHKRLLLPFAGGRRDAGAGTRLCAGDGRRRARQCEEFRRAFVSRFRSGRRAHLFLRQRRDALRHRALQDARLYRTVGRDRLDALRRERRKAAAFSLWRAGQFARPYRAAAGKQRLPHPHRNAGGGSVERRARPRRAASGLERGAGPAAPVRSAMVAADAADHGL